MGKRLKMDNPFPALWIFQYGILGYSNLYWLPVGRRVSHLNENALFKTQWQSQTAAAGLPAHADAKLESSARSS
jgi:hypothetical protein